MGQEVTRDFLTQLGYGIGYFHHYRRLHSVSIDKSIKAVPEIHSENSGLQIRSIELMLELELVNNAVMYCMDFASVFFSAFKTRKRDNKNDIQYPRDRIWFDKRVLYENQY